MTGAYFTELEAELRGLGLPQKRVADMVQELADYAADSGDDPATEFGPAAEFAGQLAAREDSAHDPAPEPGAQKWVWTCDVYVDRALLDKFGRQGWEVERVDKLGRFVSRRAADRPMSWEYRREHVKRRDREQKAAELAPEGWEPCGYWTYLAYYKRPRAADAGPAAELAAPPVTPERRTYFTRRTVRLLYAAAAAWALAVLALIFTGTSTSAWLGMLVGGVVGGCFGGFVVRRETRTGTTGEIPGVTDRSTT